MISKVEDVSNRVSPSARYIRTIAINVCLVTTLVLVFAELFAKGPLFVGDYVSAARINPWTQFFNLFKPVDLTSRNAGYGFRPYIVQWELGSSFVVSGVFASLFEGSEYAKLVILFYLVIGTVGMNQFLIKVLPYQITNQGWKWQASVRAIISLFYTLNPAVQQLVIKGYIGILAAIAFLPLVLLSYESLTRASTKGSMILRAMQVAFFVYLAATYSYPLLMVFIAIIFSEISYAIFRSDKHRTLEGLRRLSSVALFSVLLELPS